MTLKEAIYARHSVRSYTDKPIEKEKVEVLQAEIEKINKETGLHIQLVLENPEAYGNFLAHYGMFKGVRNYLAMVGKKSDDLYEKIGYHGEKLVLLAQTLGLNTCWVAKTFSKNKASKAIDLVGGENVELTIPIGYGVTQGAQHKNKPLESLYTTDTEEIPEWFKEGMLAAQAAPTAINQQKFQFTLEGDKVTVKALKGPYSEVDLGIVKYHFELASGHKVD